MPSKYTKNIRKSLSRLSDEELLQIVYSSSEEYREDAINIARQILHSRGVSLETFKKREMVRDFQLEEGRRIKKEILRFIVAMVAGGAVTVISPLLFGNKNADELGFATTIGVYFMWRSPSVERKQRDLHKEEETTEQKNKESFRESNAVCSGIMSGNTAVITKSSEVETPRLREKKTAKKTRIVMWSCLILFMIFLFHISGGFKNARNWLFSREIGHKYLKNGLVCLQKGEDDRALEYFKKAIRVNPEDPDIFLALGTVYMEKGLFANSAYFFRRAVLLNPNNGVGYMGLASAYDLLGDYEMAITYAKKAIKIFERNRDKHLEDARLLLVKIKVDKRNSLRNKQR